MVIVMNEKHLDVEWIALIKEAKDLGLTTEEIQLFLKKDHEHFVCS